MPLPAVGHVSATPIIRPCGQRPESGTHRVDEEEMRVVRLELRGFLPVGLGAHSQVGRVELRVAEHSPSAALLLRRRGGAPSHAVTDGPPRPVVRVTDRRETLFGLCGRLNGRPRPSRAQASSNRMAECRDRRVGAVPTSRPLLFGGGRPSTAGTVSCSRMAFHHTGACALRITCIRGGRCLQVPSPMHVGGNATSV